MAASSEHSQSAPKAELSRCWRCLGPGGNSGFGILGKEDTTLLCRGPGPAWKCHQKCPPSPVALCGWLRAVSHSTSTAQRVSPRGKTKRVTEILPLGSSAECFLAGFRGRFFLQGCRAPRVMFVAVQAGGCPSEGGWILWSLPAPAAPGVQQSPASSSN